MYSITDTLEKSIFSFGLSLLSACAVPTSPPTPTMSCEDWSQPLCIGDGGANTSACTLTFSASVTSTQTATSREAMNRSIREELLRTLCSLYCNGLEVTLLKHKDKSTELKKYCGVGCALYF